MLKKNDTVNIVSPATPCTFDEINRIKNYLKKIGLTSQIFLEKQTSIKKPATHEFASIDAAKRFEQFKKAIEDEKSKIIWCTRGGYGSAEILPFLMKMKKPKQQKTVIGFSDISTLNSFLIQEWRWKVISAPMLLQLANKTVSKKSEKAILDVIFGKTKELKYQLTTTKLQITADIVGGCISVLSGQFATKNQINWHDKILFLEDEGEDGERLDRYFNQITTIINESGKKPKAVLLGNFLEANPHGTPKAKNIGIAIKNFSERLGEIPLLIEKSKCLGHSKNTMPLLLGTKSEIKNSCLLQKL